MAMKFMVYHNVFDDDGRLQHILVVRGSFIIEVRLLKFSLQMGFDGDYSHKDNKGGCMHYLCKWYKHQITKH